MAPIAGTDTQSGQALGTSGKNQHPAGWKKRRSIQIQRPDQI
jgi:hypothetical protein